MTDNAQIPTPPADYFTNSQARADHFAKLVTAVGEQATQSSATPQATPSQDALDRLAATAATVRDGKQLAFEQSDRGTRFRETMHKLRTDALAGKWNEQEARAAFYKAVGEVDPQAAAAKPTDPAAEHATGSPLERAADLLDDGGRIDKDYIQNMTDTDRAELLSGFDVDLSGPDGGFVLGSDDILMLRGARDAGVDQAKVSEFVTRVRASGKNDLESMLATARRIGITEIEIAKTLQALNGG